MCSSKRAKVHFIAFEFNFSFVIQVLKRVIKFIISKINISLSFMAPKAINIIAGVLLDLTSVSSVIVCSHQYFQRAIIR